MSSSPPSGPPSPDEKLAMRLFVGTLLLAFLAVVIRFILFLFGVKVG